jgi:hypothetical protein
MGNYRHFLLRIYKPNDQTWAFPGVRTAFYAQKEGPRFYDQQNGLWRSLSQGDTVHDIAMQGGDPIPNARAVQVNKQRLA